MLLFLLLLLWFKFRLKLPNTQVWGWITPHHILTWVCSCIYDTTSSLFSVTHVTRCYQWRYTSQLVNLLSFLFCYIFQILTNLNSLLCFRSFSYQKPSTSLLYSPVTYLNYCSFSTILTCKRWGKNDIQIFEYKSFLLSQIDPYNFLLSNADERFIATHPKGSLPVELHRGHTCQQTDGSRYYREKCLCECTCAHFCTQSF